MSQSMFVTEGAVQFQVGAAFYRSSSALSRDLGVLAAQVYAQNRSGLRVLDGMSGCGVRTLRYLQEVCAGFVWANDADPDIHAILTTNLQSIESTRYRITHTSALRVLQQAMVAQQYFDVIDLDAFGNPLAFLSAGLQALRFGGLFYVTSTDGRSLSGQLPHQSMQQWGAHVRSHPAVHEQALRILLGAIHYQAMTLGYGIQPIFSLYRQSVFRVMVRLLPKPIAVLPKQAVRHYGFLGYCHQCGQFESIDWRSLGRAKCPHCHGQNRMVTDNAEGLATQSTITPPVVSGPMWLGALHDDVWLGEMQRLAMTAGWSEASALLDVMRSEAAMPPYFYTLGEVGRRGKMDIPKRDLLETALRTQGYRFSQTHIHPEGFKTDATFADCLAVVRK